VLHTVVDELPTGGIGDMVPVMLPTTDMGMDPNGVAGIIAVDDIVVDDIVVVDANIGAVPVIGEGMVPNGVDDISAAGEIAVDDIVVVDVVIEAVPPAVDGETVLGTVDDVGTGIGVMVGGGRAGTWGSGGAGMIVPELAMVVPGISDKDDVAGCVSVGMAVLLAVDVDEVAGAVDIVGAAETDGSVAVVPPIVAMELTATAGVPGAICPVGVAQVTNVPGVAGSEASGTGASVVAGAPGWVTGENGLRPLSGEDKIVPNGSPMAVVPMVETCA
jgi:hypothetical protein